MAMPRMQSRCAVLPAEPKGQIAIKTFDVREPSEKSIIVRVEFAGCCGTDPHLWTQHIPHGPETILGHEGVGFVVTMHHDVVVDHASQPLSVGDRVYWTAIKPCGECYSCTVTQDECGCPFNSYMHEYPDAVSTGSTWSTHSDFATLGPRNAFFKVNNSDVPSEAIIALGCALPTLVHAADTLAGGIPTTGKTVVVQGAGAVALASIMLTKIAGPNCVIVLEANLARMQKAREFGADVVLDITKSTLDERRQEINKIAGPAGVALVIEASGVMTAVQEGLDLVGRGGKYLLVGTGAGVGQNTFDPFKIVDRAITIQGSVFCAPRDYYHALQIVERVYDRFPLASCVTRKFGLREIELALEGSLAGKVVKAVIQPSLDV